MNKFFDSLNLGTQERRLVVAAMLAVFVVLNLWFVVPHRKDWGLVNKELKDSRETLKNYQSAIGKLRADREKVKLLEPVGISVPKDEQSIQFQRTVQSLELAFHIAETYRNFVPGTANAAQRGATNTVFFEERTMTIRFTASENDLVDFLYNLGTGNSVIRVRDLSIKPDQTQTKLTGQLTLVASYQVSGDDKLKADAIQKNSTSKKL